MKCHKNKGGLNAKHNGVFIMNIKTIIIIILCVCLVYCWTIVAYTKLNTDWKVKDYEPIEIEIPNINYTMALSTAKEKIKQLINTPHILVECNVKRCFNSPIFRVVYMNKNHTQHNYIIDYAHELTHLKYMVADETYTTCKSLILLYESNDYHLKYHALVEIKEILEGSCKSTEYDCGAYLVEYFKNKHLKKCKIFQK